MAAHRTKLRRGLRGVAVCGKKSIAATCGEPVIQGGGKMMNMSLKR